VGEGIPRHFPKSNDQNAGSEGFFPSNFVSFKLNKLYGPLELRESVQESISLREQSPRPKLPPFDYPKASPMDFFVKVADGGHTLVYISLEYNHISSPDDSTLVRVKLDCKAAGVRRISSVSLHITIPGDEVVELEPKERIDSKEVVTEFVAIDQHGTNFGLEGVGVNSPVGVGVDVNVNATKKKERQVGHQGTISSRKTIRGNIIKNNTIYWSVKEAVNGLGGDGLEGEQGEMWFVLKGKPSMFEYDCQIEHVKDFKRQTKRAMSKTWFDRYFG